MFATGTVQFPRRRQWVEHVRKVCLEPAVVGRPPRRPGRAGRLQCRGRGLVGVPRCDGTGVPRLVRDPNAPSLSLVVVPFDNLSGNSNDDYLASAVTDDLAAGLSHIPRAFVISRTTAYMYRGEPEDVRQIGNELAVRYVVHGSVQRLGQMLRVTAELASTETGAHSGRTISNSRSTTLQRAIDTYLERVCGLAPKTRQVRAHFIRRFLCARFPRSPIDLSECRPLHIRRFVTDAVAGWRPGSVAVLCGTLRAYLRFRAVHGDHTESLIAAVPRIAVRGATALPTALNGAEIQRFLDSFDCASIEGSRNYAIARCLLDLGLRAGEVARLQLEDLDWRAGTLQLRRTKSKRVDRLPIPASTGQAIVQYLQRRPVRRSNRALFVRHRPPLDAPLTVVRVPVAGICKTGAPHQARTTAGNCVRRETRNWSTFTTSLIPN
jgi:TolB-like protein/site-specific recombinase XerD